MLTVTRGNPADLQRPPSTAASTFLEPCIHDRVPGPGQEVLPFRCQPLYMCDSLCISDKERRHQALSWSFGLSEAVAGRGD